MSRLYLGLDCSTQSLSAVLIDAGNGRIVYQQSLIYADELRGYGVSNGFLPGTAGEVHAPPLMWVEALDKLLLRMRQDGCAMQRIVAVAGSGQQHGSVYVNRSFNKALHSLDPGKALHGQLTGVFSRATAPIWMDTSTGRQCAEITAAFGGPDKVNQATGSAAAERFTGPQIKKFAEQQPEAYAQTHAILLVSSFMASLCAGRHVGIDYTDASGMNLLDIRYRNWHPTALAVCGTDLAEKLTPPVDPRIPHGMIAAYFVKRYGFSPACRVLPWSGDNPGSLIGLGLVEPGMTAVSLGTSDTCFGVMRQLPETMCRWAHTFVAPTNDYMLLLCFKNGSLAREAVRKQYNLSWEQFAAAIAATPPGNNGAMMLPWFESEIVPKVDRPGAQRFGLDKQDAAANCRAVVEGQMMSIRNHAEQAGLLPKSIRVTGGASQNRAILKIIADVFGCPVDVLETDNSAALGAALRALHAVERKSWPEVVSAFTGVQKHRHVVPDTEAGVVYERLRKIFAEREAEQLA